MQGLASPRCAPFRGRSGAGAGGAPRARRQQGGGCGRPLDRVAGWVGGGIAAAFFASLERCSCVNVRTHDELDDETRDSEALLIMFDVVDGSEDAASAAAGAGGRRGRRSEKSKRGGGGCGGQLW
ncbi:hypothetical protein OsI_12986 [Oryza sativa Indica Group]|uniref:Uncharacterized protein n=1 Tax=Oryza sativa subsp. indica TaxID=39946 RepID=A2XKK7_ORYSI|nr:hypothetical protein OsI_12986 [Oryza sativa Indica Group]